MTDAPRPMHDSPQTTGTLRPLRLLVVCPSWVGDLIMATPIFSRLRRALPGAFIGGLLRPGLEELLSGTSFFDELHAARSQGVMGPKLVAAKVRPRRYDTALLLTNSFSTALITRLAGIPSRVGYDRDCRGLLLTHRLRAPLRHDGSYAPIPAVEYYADLARAFLDPSMPQPLDATAGMPMELATTTAEESAADALLARAGLAANTPLAILNPGGNNPAKRWPAERFATLARHLRQAHGLTPLVNGSPGETDLCAQIAGAGGAVALPTLGVTLGSLKALTRRARIMVTNDTGPRHIAAAFGVPLVTLFGPTDHRWTRIPTRPGGPEAIILADPTLPEDQLANDHPDRCRIDRIAEADVIAAADRVFRR